MQIPLIPIYLPAILSLMPFPLIVPLLELFSSKGGNIEFQRRKRKFPTLEIYFSKAGKFLENRGSDSMGEMLCPQSGTFAL